VEKPEALNRRIVLTGATALLGGLGSFARAQAPDPFGLKGRFIQSGYCVGRSASNAEIWVDGIRQSTASADGWFYVGFDRDSPAACRIETRTATDTQTTTVTIAPQTYDTQRIDGLPPETVTPQSPEVLERIKQDAALKAIGFASRDADDSFKNGFIWPLKNFIVSGRFGNQRILNGVAERLGLDENKVISTVAQHANTSAASIPLAWYVGVQDGRVKPGDLVLIEALGGGLTWGAAAIRL